MVRRFAPLLTALPVIAGGITLLFAWPQPGGAVPTPRYEARIAVYSFTNDINETDIWLMDPDGGNRLRITNTPGSDAYPHWSRDGRQIVFASERFGEDEIMVMDADGGNALRITNNAVTDVRPKFSPDGATIAYESFTPGFTIWVVGEDGSNPHEIAGNAWMPAWSPDGTKIAYGNLAGPRNQIWTMNADGSGKSVLVTDPVYSLTAPAWSNDGKHIAFTAEVFQPFYASYIWVADANGNNVQKFMDQELRQPSWGPGDAVRVGSTSSGDVFTVKPDGTNFTPLSGVSMLDHNPVWRPYPARLQYVAVLPFLAGE